MGRIVSPKFSAIFGPWQETELYLNYGMGFHSNDARGVNTVVDPNSGDRVNKVDPLVRTMGGEIGVRTQVVPHLTSTLALFWLESDSELVYIGDAGANEAGPGSRRYGIEFANYWRPVRWFSLDAEIAITHARFTDAGDEDHIPGSIPFMFSGGMTLGAHAEDEGFFATLRARAFDRRPLIEDNSVKGKSSFLVNAGVGYRKANWEAAVECLNLFDREDNDIEYSYTSRLRNEGPEGYDDVHLHPTEPRTFRLRVTYRF
ncbi:TonB-dependent receptor domain-containing protein [Verrucomicrobium spinosum]|uniref:TonB-dependent receptor domain-containing protein n=1 Tax=Verrucomicrobium spinosum TaxID=2736 RepID=UPI0009E7FCC9|nr:TonB-dependent receptor [Verrucomicrobium spinosum]